MSKALIPVALYLFVATAAAAQEPRPASEPSDALSGAKIAYAEAVRTAEAAYARDAATAEQAVMRGEKGTAEEKLARIEGLRAERTASLGGVAPKSPELAKGYAAYAEKVRAARKKCEAAFAAEADRRMKAGDADGAKTVLADRDAFLSPAPGELEGEALEALGKRKKPRIAGPGKVQSGTWKIVGDALVQSDLAGGDDEEDDDKGSKRGRGDGGARLSFGSADWSEYDLSLKLMIESGTSGAVVRFHVNGKSSWCCMQLGGKANNWFQATSRVNGKWNSFSATKGGLLPGRWHDFKLLVRGPKAEAFLDGKPLLKPIESAPYSKGSIEFVVPNAVAHFKDIKVVRPAGGELWTGLPAPNK